MNSKGKYLGSRRLKAPVVILAVLTTFALSFMGSFALLDRAYKRAVDERSARYVPVLVLTPGHIEVMAYSDVDEYVKAHPDSSFLIPDGQDDALRVQLQSWHQADGKLRTFTVNRQSPGHQYIEVECRGDGAWVGWYEATDTAIAPKYLKIYGPAFILLVMLLAGFLTGLGCYVVVLIRRGARRRTGRHQAP